MFFLQQRLLKKLRAVWSRWREDLLNFKGQGEFDTFLPEEIMLESFKGKARIQRYVAHRSPLRGSYCLLIILLLFGVLVGFSYWPVNRQPQNTSLDSLLMHSPSAKETVFTAAFVGDIMMGRSVESAAKFKGYDAYFKYTKDFFTGCDLVLGNLEDPIISENDQYVVAEKDILLSASKASLFALKDAGFNMLDLANNHMMDYGDKGLFYTLDALEQTGISHFGAGHDLREAMGYQLLKRKGVKVAIVGANDALVPNGFAAYGNIPGVLSIRSQQEASYLIKAVSNAAAAGDVVIVFMHWGNEYTANLDSEQRDIGRSLIDAGADVVIGSHAHVLQPVELYHNGVIFYGLGNFVMDQGWSDTKDSCLVRYCLDAAGQGVFEVIPLRIANATPAETDNPFFTKRIMHTLTKNLAPENYKLENNRLYIYPSKLQLGGNAK
ncbi:MAG: CapA family protein [Firmicutes bacterium]|nr:CapA family protein [Bacillota bacterium]